MKVFLHILKRATQAGIALAVATLLFVYIGFQVFAMGLPIAMNIVIMLGTFLVFMFFSAISVFAYFEYKSEFKPKTTNEHS